MIGPPSMEAIEEAGSILAGAMVGNHAAERWVLRNDPGDRIGFVTVGEGWGADDLARSVCVLAGIALVKLFLGGVAGFFLAFFLAFVVPAEHALVGWASSLLARARALARRVFR